MTTNEIKMSEADNALSALDRIEAKVDFTCDEFDTLRTYITSTAGQGGDDAIEAFCRTWLHCGMEEAKTLHQKLWAKNQAIKEDAAALQPHPPQPDTVTISRESLILQQAIEDIWPTLQAGNSTKGLTGDKVGWIMETLDEALSLLNAEGKV